MKNLLKYWKTITVFLLDIIKFSLTGMSIIRNPLHFRNIFLLCSRQILFIITWYIECFYTSRGLYVLSKIHYITCVGSVRRIFKLYCSINFYQTKKYKYPYLIMWSVTHFDEYLSTKQKNIPMFFTK